MYLSHHSSIVFKIIKSLFPNAATRLQEEHTDSTTVAGQTEHISELSECDAKLDTNMSFGNKIKCSIVQLSLLSYLTVSTFLLKCYVVFQLKKQRFYICKEPSNATLGGKVLLSLSS